MPQSSPFCCSGFLLGLRVFITLESKVWLPPPPRAAHSMAR